MMPHSKRAFRRGRSGLGSQGVAVLLPPPIPATRHGHDDDKYSEADEQDFQQDRHMTPNETLAPELRRSRPRFSVHARTLWCPRLFGPNRTHDLWRA